MLAPLIIEPLIVALLLLLAGWISDLLERHLGQGPEPRIRRIPLHERTSATSRPAGKHSVPVGAFTRSRDRVPRIFAGRLERCLHHWCASGTIMPASRSHFLSQ